MSVSKWHRPLFNTAFWLSKTLESTLNTTKILLISWKNITRSDPKSSTKKAKPTIFIPKAGIKPVLHQNSLKKRELISISLLATPKRINRSPLNHLLAIWNGVISGESATVRKVTEASILRRPFQLISPSFHKPWTVGAIKCSNRSLPSPKWALLACNCPKTPSMIYCKAVLIYWHRLARIWPNMM